MPELPDLEAYRVALERSILGQTLNRITLLHPFLLRTVSPDPADAEGRAVSSVSRVGKRIVLAFERGPCLAFHLMIAGRFGWRPGAPGGPRRGSRAGTLAELEFSAGVLSLTEAGTKRRASLHVLADRAGLAVLGGGGLELLDDCTAGAFAARLRCESHTVKRALTDGRLFSGIGNAYSDEILFRARLSPFAMTGSLDEDEVERLYRAAVATLAEWRDRLVAETERGFPRVTAFRPEMEVHGRYGQPCRASGTPVQRVRYAENECNYCPTCQAGGRVYADRALSRLLKGDWPRTVEELERLGRPPGG